MAGSEAQGANLVRMALEALQKALPMIPMGSELHTSVLKSVADISKQVGKVGGASDPSAVIQQLAQLAREQKQQAVPPAMMGAPPGAPPPPPPGAGGAAPPHPAQAA